LAPQMDTRKVVESSPCELSFVEASESWLWVSFEKMDFDKCLLVVSTSGQRSEKLVSRCLVPLSTSYAEGKGAWV
jgi:hypothetical protein